MDHSERLRLAEALNGKAEALACSYRYREALWCLKDMLERFGAARDGELGKQVQIALACRGSVLIALGRLEEAGDAFDELCRQAQDARDPTRTLAHARRLIAERLRELANELHEVERFEEVTAVVDLLLSYFDREDPRECATLLLDGLLLKARALACLDRDADAVALLYESVAWLGDVEDPGVRAGTGMALHELANLLVGSGQLDLALR